MPERIELSDEQRRALLDPALLPDSVVVRGRKYAPEAPVDSGFKAGVWRVLDEYGRPRALKLCIYSDYEDRSFLEELSRAARLDEYNEFAHFVDAGLVTLELGRLEEQHFVCFVEEWIDGLTLEQFIERKRDLVTTSFFLAYLKGMCRALSALREIGLRHDDLHIRNVMLARPAAGDLVGEWSVKVIDMGSTKPAGAAQLKPKDDHRNFVEHLVHIWNAIHGNKNLTVKDRRFLSEAVHLFHSMLDEDPSVALRDPAQIITQFELAHTRASASRREELPTPSSPFEFISAEHIADDRLLVRLFARSCPFLEKVEGPDPCLVTGPRGCGKSTMFRWLSLKAHLHKSRADIERLRIAGFYISCSSDLQNKIGWVKTDAMARLFRSEIVHYFNLLLGREVLQTLAMISERSDREDYWGFGPAQELMVWRFIVESIGSNAQPLLQGVSRLAQAIELIEREMFLTHTQMIRRLNRTCSTSEAFLGDFTSLLAERVSFFRKKRVAFLVDDFSVHRLPAPVQIVLNKVVWERRASHIFKLSSEKYGTKLTDSLGATVDVSREMVEVDCGREFIALDDSDQVERARLFAVELLENRLQAAGYKSTADALIGRSEWPEGSLGRALGEKEEGRSLDQYHGIDCIAGVCSGDVSTLLLVYRRIFELGNVTSESTSRVPKNVQHEAIVSVSRELFEAIRHHVPNGAEMYSVVSAFGTLIRNILQHGRWLRKGQGTTPSQCPRIELDQKEGGAIEALSSEQRELALELVRRAIFIEMEPGLSRHGNVTTLRWHLRRVYLPSFSAALAKNDAIKEPISWLKFLLTNPKGACDYVWKKRPKRTSGEQSLPLFGDQY